MGAPFFNRLSRSLAHCTALHYSPPYDAESS